MPKQQMLVDEDASMHDITTRATSSVTITSLTHLRTSSAGMTQQMMS
jgi:hypothetical protein